MTEARHPIFLTEGDVARLLDRATTLSVVEDTLRGVAQGRAVDGPKIGMNTDGDGGRCFVGSVFGYLRDDHMVGVKTFATASGNTARGLPRVPATIILSDSRTGVLKGIVEATSITATRTAALAIAAVRPWICGSIRKAAIIGFGAIGQEIARYLGDAFQVAEIAIFGRDAAKMRSLCEGARSERMPLRAVGAVEDAVADAEVIFTATGLTENKPVVKGDGVKDGAVVCALGSYQEIDGRVVEKAGRIFVDHWEAMQHRGNLAPMIAAGRVDRQSVDDIADVVAGKITAAKSASQTILVVLIGMGSLDVALAAHALRAAHKRGMGLPLGGTLMEHEK